MSTEFKNDLIDTIALRDDARAPTGGSAANARHYDDYFRIDRTEDPAAWWAGAQRVARLVVDDLPATDLDEDLQADLLAGVSRLLLASTSVPAHSGTTAPSGADEHGAHGMAARRWKLGHHLFHHLLSLMNSHADGAVAALAGEPDWATTRGLVAELAALYDAATATMHYASSFPAAAYAQTIRPSMAPPWMPPGFSGVFNREHQVLLDRLGALRPRLRGRASRSLPAEVAVAARALWRAQSRNRRDHVLICEKFVPGGGSLLQQHFAGADAESKAGSSADNAARGGAETEEEQK